MERHCPLSCVHGQIMADLDNFGLFDFEVCCLLERKWLLQSFIVFCLSIIYLVVQQRQPTYQKLLIVAACSKFSKQSCSTKRIQSFGTATHMRTRTKFSHNLSESLGTRARTTCARVWWPKEYVFNRFIEPNRISPGASTSLHLAKLRVPDELTAANTSRIVLLYQQHGSVRFFAAVAGCIFSTPNHKISQADWNG